MPKIHPRSTGIDRSPNYETCQPTTLTVWNKSLIFNCKGFTVYDSNGNLVFRVDNYASNPSREIILMDATGKDLLVLRRKRLSLRKQWQGFCEKSLIFRTTRSTCSWWVNKKKNKMLAEVFLESSKHSDFYVEGSFCKRSCAVYDSAGAVVAEVKRKQAATTNSIDGCMLEADVFSLVVQPGYDQPMVMGFIITLDSLTNKPTFLRRLLNK